MDLHRAFPFIAHLICVALHTDTTRDLTHFLTRTHGWLPYSTGYDLRYTFYVTFPRVAGHGLLVLITCRLTFTARLRFDFGRRPPLPVTFTRPLVLALLFYHVYTHTLFTIYVWVPRLHFERYGLRFTHVVPTHLHHLPPPRCYGFGYDVTPAVGYTRAFTPHVVWLMRHLRICACSSLPGCRTPLLFIAFGRCACLHVACCSGLDDFCSPRTVTRLLHSYVVRLPDVVDPLPGWFPTTHYVYTALRVHIQFGSFWFVAFPPHVGSPTHTPLTFVTTTYDLHIYSLVVVDIYHTHLPHYNVTHVTPRFPLAHIYATTQPLLYNCIAV